MAIVAWPHAHLPHAICEFLTDITPAAGRVTIRVPRERIYPLIVVQPAGLGTLGTDAAIQADESRLQIDVWAKGETEALTIAATIFRLLDARFEGALRFETLSIEDETASGTFFECKIERIVRSGGGDTFWDEFAKVYRATAFYNCKLNL